jgi:hypothetical protein
MWTGEKIARQILGQTGQPFRKIFLNGEDFRAKIVEFQTGKIKFPQFFNENAGWRGRCLDDDEFLTG